MVKNKSIRTVITIVLLVLTVQACSVPATEEPTATPAPPTATDTPAPTATVTQTPTKTPTKTPRPNVKATKEFEDFFSNVQMFKDEGLIPSTSGEYIELNPYFESFAQIGWLRYRYFDDVELENFMFGGHVKWSTAIDTSDKSGCGIVFAVEVKEPNNEYYGVVLDKSRIFFSIAGSGHYRELGKTSGSGRLKFGNPAEADVILLVYNNQAYVYVDDEFISKYTLSKDKELRGLFGFGIISGTNKDYGTLCQISDSKVWSLDP